MKDAGMDPLDMDLSQEPQYQAGNHQVTDTEVAFRQVLEDVKSSPEGQETLVHIDRDWDQTRQELLVQNPDVLRRFKNNVSTVFMAGLMQSSASTASREYSCNDTLSCCRTSK